MRKKFIILGTLLFLILIFPTNSFTSLSKEIDDIENEKLSEKKPDMIWDKWTNIAIYGEYGPGDNFLESNRVGLFRKNINFNLNKAKIRITSFFPFNNYRYNAWEVYGNIESLFGRATFRYGFGTQNDNWLIVGWAHRVELTYL